MALNAAQLASASRLLDEALDLDAAQRERWLAGLGAEHAALVPALRQMLASQDAGGEHVLDRAPRLPVADDESAPVGPGETVGPYRLVRELGRGGMGTVWLAERSDGTFERQVALKLPRIAWTEGLAQRMAREQRISARLEHPAIARLYDAGLDAMGRPFIAMEYIDGVAIDQYVSTQGLAPAATLRLMLPVIRAVAYAHGRLVIHRDLKPSNVMVDAAGQAHLLDFGIAKLLQGGEHSALTQEYGRALTPRYAAPEQITGDSIGVQSDVYSLGVMLYELLTGASPYAPARTTPGALEQAILQGPIAPPSSRVADAGRARKLKGEIDAIVGKALKREAAERYATADALGDDIERYLAGLPVRARPDSALYRLRKAVVRHRVPVLASSAVLAAALAGGTATFVQSRKTAEEAERTRLATAFVSELLRINASQQPPISDDAARPNQSVFVDRGAALIEARFQGQSDLKAEMYGVVSRAYADLGMDVLAGEYATRELEALRAQSATATQIARALALLTELALSTGRGIDAEEYARQSINLLTKGDKLFPEALALLARAQLRNGNTAEATQSVAQAKDWLETHGVQDSSARAWLLFIEGDLLARQNRFEDGRPLYAAAISHALKADGPTSRAAIEMRLLLAERLITRNRVGEARDFGDAAIAALESLGDISGARAQRAKAFLQLKKFEARATSFAETMGVLQDASGRLQAMSSSIPFEVLAEIDFYKARALMQWGEFESAQPLLKSSTSILQQSTQNFDRKFSLAAFNGIAAMYLGDHDEANRFLRERMKLRIKRGWAEVPFAAFDWAYIALNLSLAGHHQHAEAFLLGAPAFSSLQGDSVADYSRVVPEMLARVRLQAGDITGAKQALSLPDPPYEDKLDLFSSFQLRGEILCATGEHAAGLVQLTRSIDSLSRYTGPNHPGLGRLRAVAGLCALPLGKRKLAMELAEGAQNAITAQPNVSPYFKEPVERLEQRLRSMPS